VPDVTNQNQPLAESMLRGAGFTVAVVYQPVNDPSQDGIVLSQDPTGGSDAQAGEVVTITVGQLQSGGTTTTTTTPTTTQ
jgi:serine/threonine-protein kinase